LRNFYELDPAEQQRRSLDRLFRYLREYVAPFHPYLRKLYRQQQIDIARLRTPDDLRRLPIITKAQLREDPQAFVLRPAFPGVPVLPGYETLPPRKSMLAGYALRALLNRPFDHTQQFRRPSFRDRIRRRAQLEWLPAHFHASSGSTGKPTPAVYTHHDLTHVVKHLASQLMLPHEPNPDEIYWDLADRGMSLFPGAPHLAFFSTVLAKILVGTSCFETGGGHVIPTDRQVTLFFEGGFSSLVAIPSYVVYWLRRALALQAEGKIGPLAKLQHIALGAEPVSEALRENIRTLAHAAGADPRLKVYVTLGMTEMKWWFGECNERSGLHLNPRYYYWELLDPQTREPVPEGAPGVLVLSHIDWRGTVLVRYWTGDLAKGGLRWQRCPLCGYTFPLLFGPICRAEKDFTKIKGSQVDLSELVDCIRSTPGVRLFQASLENEESSGERSRDILSLDVLPEAGADLADLEDRLKHCVKATVEITPDRIHFETDEDRLHARLFATSPVKAEYIVERRKQ
jgi:phenylacetate-coenzyme A ligase PaaK-like adenylate-forming protein